MTLDEQINDILAQIRAAAKAGNQVRLRRIIRDLVEESENPQLVHQERLKTIGDDTVELCKYLGEIAVSETDVERKLGRDMNDNEKRAFAEGQLDRRIAANAVVVKTALRGGRATVLEWMQK